MAKTAPKVQTVETPVAAENGRAQRRDRSLRVDEAGVARLRERLGAANRDNPDFEAQFEGMMGIASRALEKLRIGFGDEIELVVAIGGWAREGIDLRQMFDSEEIVLQVVFGTAEVDIDLIGQAFEVVASEVLNGSFYLQFTPELIHLRKRSLALPWNQGREDAVGIPLLVRG